MKKPIVFTNGCTPKVSATEDVIELTNEEGHTVRVSMVLIRRAMSIIQTGDKINLKEVGNA